jgi:hypothetical protein
MEFLATYDNESGCLKHTFGLIAVEIFRFVDKKMFNMPKSISHEAKEIIGDHHLLFVYNRNLTHVARRPRTSESFPM